MGSSNSKEKELNEDLERIRKERIARERAERDRVANSKLILVKVTSPPGCEIEIHEAVTVRVFLEKIAPLFGLNKSAAPSLQVEFSETILEHELELKGAGMRDESLCSVLGVEAALEKRKAEARKAKAAALEARKANIRKAKAMDIVKAAEERRIADVQFVLQFAPERVNDQSKDWVLLLLHTHALLTMAVGQDASTALHKAADISQAHPGSGLEIAKVLVAANANVDIVDYVRAGCSWLGAGY